MNLLGRAELLRGLLLAQQHEHAEHGLALAAGYALEPSQSEAAQDSPVQAEAVAGKGVMQHLTHSNATTQTNTRPTPAKHARFWGVTERRAIEVAEPQVFNDLSPLQPEDWQAAPDSVPPAWHNIIPQARLMPALKRSLASRRCGGVDIERLVQALSQGKALQRLPRRLLKGWTAHLLLVLDMSETLLPYHKDMHLLVLDLRRWLGPSNVEVRVINDERYPLGDYSMWNADASEQDVQSKAGGNWLSAACTGRVLLVSEMGLIGGASNQTTAAWGAWLHVLGRQGAQVEVWCPLPLGLAGENPVLPRVPVVHWSAASHLRPRQLPMAEMHRTPERLKVGQALCTLLAMVAWVEPGLVRALRVGMGPMALDAGLEQLAWDNPAMTRLHGARMLKPASLPEMRKNFALLSSLEKQRVLDMVLNHHSAHNRMLAHVEALTWAAYATPEERVERGEVISAAQKVMQRFAHDPWQHDGLDKATVREFIARYLRDADQLTRAFCSPSMSRMKAALHIVRHGDAEMTTSLPGLAAADLAAAMGQTGLRQPYWLALDSEHGWLVLSHTQPLTQCLLEQQPVLVDCLSIQMGNAVRWAQVKPPRELALVRLPWGLTGKLVDEPIYLDTGIERLTIAEIARPAWALEWGRDRAGLYALMPNPFGEPARVSYPRGREPVQISVPTPLSSGTVPKRKAKAKQQAKQTATFSIQALTLGLDEIGPLATLTVESANGLHLQTLRYIAPGRFLMGSPEAETADLSNPEWYEDERPQHYVTISEGFWLADTACTQGFWQAVTGENPSRFNADNKGGPAHPVENVSWDMIQAFLQALQRALAVCLVTLPTEAEWEYACRAGTSTPFSFGGTINPAQVNYDGNYPYGEGEEGEYRAQTVAVKELPANEWGLYQMHGNVWEWCADKFGEYTVDVVRDPGLADALVLVPDKDAARVLRGGGWVSFARFARSAVRNHDQPGRRDDDTGFRWAFRSKSQASGV